VLKITKNGFSCYSASMWYYRINNIKLKLDEKEDCIKSKIAANLHLSCNHIAFLKVIRKSIDARRHKAPEIVYTVEIGLESPLDIPNVHADEIHLQTLQELNENIPEMSLAKHSTQAKVVIVGAGPAGLFAAYYLSMKGIPAVLLERGSSIERRIKNVEEFWQRGILHPQSNVLFGEGGAGTFSDGKLTSRSKHPYARWIKKILVEMGAPTDILIDAKPHMGTDTLRTIIPRLRKTLLGKGTRVFFDAEVTDFVIYQGKIKSVIINNQDELPMDHLILAIGQNAEDTYRKLFLKGVKMAMKPFAIGLRAEHPQELINEIQYGKWQGHPQLPPAEYFVTAYLPEINRSVYSFCMCPGGTVIGCSTKNGFLCVNGMSNSNRLGRFANAAIVVNVRTEDFDNGSGPLCGLEFRAMWERKAFLFGGGEFRAPAQRITDYLRGTTCNQVGATSFLPGVKPALMDNVLPYFVNSALKRGFIEIDRKMRGFISREAHLIGVETRTSSPLRICRGSDGQSETVKGIYPCGEGAGYAGGIISSAVDGIKTAKN